jgi:hypothetical protein
VDGGESTKSLDRPGLHFIDGLDGGLGLKQAELDDKDAAPGTIRDRRTTQHQSL